MKKRSSEKEKTSSLFIIIVSSILFISFARTVPVHSADVNKAPPWYKGTMGPWESISKEQRKEILRMRRGFEAIQSKAHEPSKQKEPVDLATNGRKLIKKICNEYGVRSDYHTAHMFGPRMVIWLPEAAWKKLSSSQKESIKAYMKSKYANWGIGVGPVSGKDIMADRLVVER